MVASKFSGATEISGALIDCSESFCGQSKEDWVWFTGNSGVAIKHRKPINPAMIAVQAMMTAVSESTYPVYGLFTWNRMYHSMLATPLTVSDLLLGHLAVVAAQGGFAAAAFVAIFWGQAPFPAIVRDLQRVIGDEARSQCQTLLGGDPDVVVACVGGGSMCSSPSRSVHTSMKTLSVVEIRSGPMP